MGPRTNYLINHPLIKTPAPIISEVKAIDFGDLIAVNATFDGAQRAWLMYRQSKKGTFKRVEMFDDGGNSDGVGGDGIWGATVDMEKKKKNFQYYIIAEGAKAAALSPEKASSEFHTLKR